MPVSISACRFKASLSCPSIFALYKDVSFGPPIVDDEVSNEFVEEDIDQTRCERAEMSSDEVPSFTLAPEEGRLTPEVAAAWSKAM